MVYVFSWQILLFYFVFNLYADAIAREWLYRATRTHTSMQFIQIDYSRCSHPILIYFIVVVVVVIAFFAIFFWSYPLIVCDKDENERASKEEKNGGKDKPKK